MGQSNTIISYAAPASAAPSKPKTPTTNANHPSTLLDTIFNSITISLIEAPWWIAMLALVFTGSLAPYLGQAALFLMAGSLLSMTVISSLCSWKGAIWLPQDIPTAILVVATAEITRRVALTASLDTVFVTVIVTIGLASVTTGILLYLLGTFKLGKVVRWLPFPVLAGFIGATGCLLVIGGINNSLVNPETSDLMALETTVRWLPTLLLALFMYVLGLYSKHALLIPLSMLVASLCFFAVTHAMGISLESLAANGWIFKALPPLQHSFVISLAQFQQVDWAAITSQSGSLLLIAAVSAIAMLLNNSGFELSIKSTFDQNKDLRATGIANFLAGLVGGWPGYMSPALSSINARQGRQLPYVGFLAAILTGTLLWHATQLIELIPRFVVGSVIAYVGVSFLFDWVIKPAKRLPISQYIALLVMVGVFISLGSML